MYSLNVLPYPSPLFFTRLLYDVAKIGSTPDVTRETIAPLPVGATVVKVQFRTPFCLIFSCKDFGRFFMNLLLKNPFQSKLGNCPFSSANSALVSYAVSLKICMICSMVCKASSLSYLIPILTIISPRPRMPRPTLRSFSAFFFWSSNACRSIL